MRRACAVFDISSSGLTVYQRGWLYQRLLHDAVHRARGKSVAEQCDYALILQHPSVYTLGKGASEENIKFIPGSDKELVKIERGGDVTWHGPGQLVMYPIIDLQCHRKDLHW
jgi:lipoyl(octanoyl) transferase